MHYISSGTGDRAWICEGTGKGNRAGVSGDCRCNSDRVTESVWRFHRQRNSFPLADHISFAVARIRRNEQISNPLTEDIKVLFYSEFKVAETLKTILRERLQIEIDDHEVGYVALHIHSAIGDEKVSVAMQTARAVRECIDMIEKATGKPIDVLSLSYNRLMNHMKYMVARASTGEKLNLDMNEYMLDQYPQAYKVATDICKTWKDVLDISWMKQRQDIWQCIFRECIRMRYDNQ